MVSTLQESIERIYTTFADVPKPQRIEGCPHCIDNKGIEILLSTPLREITPGELSPYAASAFLTVGDVADYLYFLPRILEISAVDSSWWPSPAVTARAIRATNMNSWPKARLDTIQEFLTSVIHTAIHTGPYCSFDLWLCAIGQMGFDVRPFLQQIAAKPEAVLSYFEDNADCLPLNRLSNSFWELPSEAHDAIVAWFKSDDIRRIPFDAYGYLS